MPKLGSLASAARARREKAIVLLASGTSQQRVADAVGVSRKTLWEWSLDSTFAAELRSLQEQHRGAATERLRALVAPAIDRLAGLAVDGIDAHGTAVSALVQKQAASELLALAGLSQGAAAAAEANATDSDLECLTSEQLAKRLDEAAAALRSPKVAG